MLSVIIPFHNEEKNLPLLYQELLLVLDKSHQAYEILFVDDGSTDKSVENIQQVSQSAQQKNKARLIRLRKRSGKGEALRTGLQHAAGNIIIFMDGDLQDDPRDIPAMLEKLQKGHDFVNGVRASRKENMIVQLYSKLVNAFLKHVLHSPFTDINCGFKAFGRHVLEDIVLYGNNFRFLPLAAFYKGYRVTETPVANRKRLHGRSKYGIQKLFIGIIDTVTAYFLYRFAEQPLHFFGIIGGLFFLAGFAISLYLTIERLFFNILLYRRPALLLGILLIIVGLQVVMTGIIGELIVYINKRTNPQK